MYILYDIIRCFFFVVGLSISLSLWDAGERRRNERDDVLPAERDSIITLTNCKTETRDVISAIRLFIGLRGRVYKTRSVVKLLSTLKTAVNGGAHFCYSRGPVTTRPRAILVTRFGVPTPMTSNNHSCTYTDVFWRRVYPYTIGKRTVDSAILFLHYRFGQNGERPTYRTSIKTHFYRKPNVFDVYSRRNRAERHWIIIRLLRRMYVYKIARYETLKSLHVDLKCYFIGLEKKNTVRIILFDLWWLKPVFIQTYGQTPYCICK